MKRNPADLNFAHIRRRCDRAADTFSSADFVHRTTAEGLMQRMQPMTIEPRRILDLGCAAGAGSRQLLKRFRKARVLSLDASARMLTSARAARGWLSRAREVQGNARCLPVQTASIDLVYSNLLFPMIDDLPACLAEVARVLRKDGLFAFSTFGPDSLAEVRAAWRNVDDGLHVRQFADMHILGDAVSAAGLRDPVLDIDHLTIRYRDPDALFADLKATGTGNSLQGRRQSLTGKGRLNKLREELQIRSGEAGFEIRLELVYGHAWGGGAAPPPGEFRVAPSAIGRR